MTHNTNNKDENIVIPFHPGELDAQEKSGTRGVAAELFAFKQSTLGSSHNKNNVNAFFAEQAFAVISSVDKHNNNNNDDNDDDQQHRVWVTPLFAPFSGNNDKSKGDWLSVASESEIRISADSIPKNDILHHAMTKPGTPLSLLGIDLLHRKRHRINGIVGGGGNVDGQQQQQLSLLIKEYSPNCPKYINRRELIVPPPSFDKNNSNNTATTSPPPPPVRYEERTELSESDQEFIRSMDTLWIGSYAPGVGADTNHRGGKPGFIRVIDSKTIEWPEYRGNGMYYTSGNLQVNKRCGVTVFDFDKTGNMIQMTGNATVDWDHDGTYEGASRVIKFEIETLIRTDHVTTHRWKLLEYSPYNPNVAGGGGADGNATGNNNNDTNMMDVFPTTATLAKIVTESSPQVKTFRFVVPRQIPFLPGQYATFEFENIPGGSSNSNSGEVRTWTLSETPNSINGDNTLDITVKRMSKGLVTNWLHDHAQVGLQVKLLGVDGDMTAIRFAKNSSKSDDNDNINDNNKTMTKKPVVPENLLLLSAGIGITPNLAMVRGIGAFELQNSTNITMIHVERNESDLICQSELQRRARSYPNFKLTNIITGSSKQGENRRLTLEQLTELVPTPKLQQAYVCGPTGFMNDMTDYLVSMGVPSGKVHTESFEF